MPNSISNLHSVLFGPEPNPGTRLGSYTLDHKVEAAGMGHVWISTREQSGRLCAIKQLPLRLTSDADAWEEAMVSIHRLRDLSHPHIPTHIDLMKDPEWGAFLVTAYVDGIELEAYRHLLQRHDPRNAKFSVHQVGRLLARVASALDYSISKLLIHGAVRPEHILVERAGNESNVIANVTVIGFPLVYLRPGERFPSYRNVPYMAPELLKTWHWGRDPTPPTPRSDQYSLAVIAYELLAGDLPFKCDDLESWRSTVQLDRAEPIPEINNRANEAIRQAMSKDPQDRFRTCTDFVIALCDTV